MKTLLALLAGALVLASPAQAQPRVYSQAELDTLLAPVALHPDGLLSQILIAATYPDEVADAANWSRANPHLRGDDAVRAVQYEPWDPAVKALVAFPDLITRMAESPQWLQELGEAFLWQQAQVMDTVQGLRRRAQAAGTLNDSEHAVYMQGDAIVVQPRTQIVYVRYYDPYVVYGPWWWPHYHPVVWSPWVVRPVYFTRGFFYCAPDWHRHHVRVVHRPVHVPHQVVTHVVPGKWQHVARTSIQQHVRTPEARRVPEARREVTRPAAQPRPHVRTPEANRQPIVKQHMPAAHGFSQNRPTARAPEVRRDPPRAQPPRAQPPRIEARREMRFESRRELQKEPKGRGWGQRG